jgi:hypothetical protein
MMKTFEQHYPHLAAWIQDGWIEIGRTDYDSTFIRVLDEGGMIWSSDDDFATIDHALAAADAAVQAWCRHQMPDLIIGEHDANVYTLHEGQILAFIYNYTQITGEPPLERDIQNYFDLDAAAVHQLIETLEENRFISRVPGQERSVRVLVPPQMLPALEAV